MEKLSKYLIFGGSFNPIHIVHMHMAKEANELGQFNRVIWIPTRSSPHKNSDLIAHRHRVEMLRLICNVVSQYEVFEGDQIYIVDTLLKVIDMYGYNNAYYMLIGEDSYNQLETWIDYERILEMLDGLFIHLRNSTSILINPQIQLPVTTFGRKNYVSSSEFRKNPGIRTWIPDVVMSYIKTNNLYTKGYNHEDSC